MVYQKQLVVVLAPAKLNLSLDVAGLLPNGYHDLDMVMQTIDLYERITLRRSADLTLRLPGSFVPPNDKNTAYKAAVAFFHYTGLLAGVDITIQKHVPVRAGMAGGSADGLFGGAEIFGLVSCHLHLTQAQLNGPHRQAPFLSAPSGGRRFFLFDCTIFSSGTQGGIPFLLVVHHKNPPTLPPKIVGADREKPMTFIGGRGKIKRTISSKRNDFTS